MTRKQKILAAIRAWIDRRLPRDVLVISIHGIKDNGAMTAPLWHITHMEGILICKMQGSVVHHYNGELVVHMHTEHLSV